MKRKTKSRLLVLVLLLAIGFASVTTSLVINGTIGFNTNEEDFDVIFTKSVIDGIDMSTSTISNDGKSLVFTTNELSIINDTSKLEFVVTNNSTQYDASVSMECISNGTKENTYYKIEKELPELISAATSENGIVTVTLLKTSVEEIEETFTCTIDAVAQERDMVGEKKVEWSYTDLDSNGVISIGDIYSLGTENFNVISQTDDTIKLLSENCINSSYRQTNTVTPIEYTVVFSNSNGWEYTPGPKEINIQDYDGSTKTYINNYVDYLNRITKDDYITGDLITLNELKNLGCPIKEDYAYNGQISCSTSSYIQWIANGQYWWTKSANSTSDTNIWRITDIGDLSHGSYNKRNGGIRPVITVPKTVLENI